MLLEVINLEFNIDSFYVFRRTLIVEGWAFDENQLITGINIVLGSSVIGSLTEWLPSKDVENVYGKIAKRCRFELESKVNTNEFESIKLFFLFSDGSKYIVEHPGDKAKYVSDKNFILREKFVNMVNRFKHPRLLEIGSRNNTVYKELFSDYSNYTGFDIKEGNNVDVVGDAHKLSQYFKPNEFEVIFSVSVFEHLAMPWKVVLEMNKIMKKGGICFITSHQTWGVHEHPWDFWRFSDSAWRVLFSKDMGFEVIDAQMGELATVVPQLPNAITVLNSEHYNCYQGSCVVAKKIAESSLVWNVESENIVLGDYPS